MLLLDSACQMDRVNTDAGASSVCETAAVRILYTHAVNDPVSISGGGLASLE